MILALASECIMDMATNSAARCRSALRMDHHGETSTFRSVRLAWNTKLAVRPGSGAFHVLCSRFGPSFSVGVYKYLPLWCFRECLTRNDPSMHPIHHCTSRRDRSESDGYETTRMARAHTDSRLHTLYCSMRQTWTGAA